MKLAAVIVSRKDSVRIQYKSRKKINDQSLVERKISQLKKVNSIIPKTDKILFSKPTNFSKPLAKIEKGRVLLIQNCNNNWCKIKTDDFKGWVKVENSWGLN